MGKLARVFLMLKGDIQSACFDDIFFCTVTLESVSRGNTWVNVDHGFQGALAKKKRVPTTRKNNFTID